MDSHPWYPGTSPCHRVLEEYDRKEVVTANVSWRVVPYVGPLEVRFKTAWRLATPREPDVVSS